MGNKKNLKKIYKRTKRGILCRKSKRVLDVDNSTNSLKILTNINTDLETPLTDNSQLDSLEKECSNLSEYEQITEHKLDIESERSTQILTGKRIVDINYLLNWSLNLQRLHSQKCSTGLLQLIKEERSGFYSKFHFRCNLCNELVIRESEEPKEQTVNKAVVLGTVATGSTFSHMQECMSCIDIPCMSKKLYQKIENQIFETCTQHSWDDMKNNASKEREVAIKKNQIDKSGVPWTTVYVDGGWSKRSYGHNYNANSGVAVVIGKETGKLLYLGVRNKFCIVCAKAESKEETAPKHNCFLNWKGSSSAMEADIVVEAFNRSESMYGLKFRKFIADADSSVFTKIQKEVSYGYEVEKVDCTNHAIKNYGKKLYLIKNDTQTVSLAARKLLTVLKIKMLQNIAYEAIYNNAHGDVQDLIDDLINGPLHVFQFHKNCKETYCDKVGDETESLYAELRSTGLHRHIQSALNMMIRRAKYIIDNETNNRSELFMSVMNRFNLGKRMNLIQRGSFSGRAFLTSLRYNKGSSWMLSPWRKIMKRSPGAYTKSYISTMERRKLTTTARRQLFHNIRKRKLSRTVLRKKNLDYGDAAEQPELDDNTVMKECTRIIASLNITEEERDKLATDTIGQFDNILYRSERKNRLTASNFGLIFKRRDYTPCDSAVRTILNTKPFSTHATEYGKVKERVAISLLEEKLATKVEPCGLYIDLEYPFLAASPDGIINNECLVEVKSFYSVAKSRLTLEQAATNIPNFCLKLENGILSLKRNHNYYYQIQGQLNITGKSVRIFVGFVNDDTDLYIEYIGRDLELWQKMIEKLVRFYKQCVAPEIVRKRIPRNLKCLDPDYIKDAIKLRENINKKKEDQVKK